ncbi:hypothetical protein Tco_0514764 [Tanacetum coccineum]
MAESSQQEQVPQQVQPNEPGSPIPFEPATQVLLDIGDIIFNDNNEVSLLYPPHSNSDYFKIYTAKALKNSKVWFSTPTGGILGEVGLTTFKNSIEANYLSYSTEYAEVPSLETALKKNQAEGPPFTAYMLPICNADEPMAFKAPITSSKAKKKLVYSTSTILHFESTLRHDASTTSTAEADPGKTIPNDSVSQQQDKTKSASKGLEVVHTKLATGKWANYIEKDIAFAKDQFNTSPNISSFDDTKTEIKLEDLSKLVPNLEVDFMDLDSDDQPIIIEGKEDEEVHSKKDQAEKTLNFKLVKEREAAKTEGALLKDKPSFPHVEQLIELLVKSHKPELSKLLTSRDFSNSLPTELKELPSKFTDLTREVKELKKYVEKLEVELLGYLKEIPSKMEKFTSILTISQLFQRKIAKDAKRANLNKQLTTTVITPTIPTTSQFQSPFFPSPPKGSPKTERELIKKDKGKKAMSSKDAKAEDTRSDSNKDANLTGSIVDERHLVRDAGSLLSYPTLNQARMSHLQNQNICKRKNLLVKWVDKISPIAKEIQNLYHKGLL